MLVQTSPRYPTSPFDDRGRPITNEEINFLTSDYHKPIKLLHKITKCDIKYHLADGTGPASLRLRGAADRLGKASDCINHFLESYRNDGSIRSAEAILMELAEKEGVKIETEPAEPDLRPKSSSSAEICVLEDDSVKQCSQVRIRKSALLHLDKFSRLLGDLKAYRLKRNASGTVTLVIHGPDPIRQQATAALVEDVQSKHARQETKNSSDIIDVLPRVASSMFKDPKGFSLKIGPQHRSVHLRSLPEYFDTVDGKRWVFIQGTREEVILAKRWLQSLSVDGSQMVSQHQDAAQSYAVTGNEHMTTFYNDFKGLMRKVLSPVFLVTSTAVTNNKSKAQKSPLAGAFRGMTVSSFTTVTMTPFPVVCFNVKEPSRTLAAVVGSGRFYAHIIADNDAGAALADLFTKAYEDPAEPFLRSSDVGSTKLMTSRSGPIFTGKAVVGGLHCKVMHDKSVVVGDHKVIFAEVTEVTPSEPESQQTGLAYAHRAYMSAGSSITPQQLVNKRIDPALYEQEMSRYEHASSTEDHARFEEDDLDSANGEAGDDPSEYSLEQSKSEVYEEPNADVTSRYFEEMEHEGREQENAEMDTVNSTKNVDRPQCVDQEVASNSEAKVVQDSAAETDLAPGYKPDLPKDKP